MKVLFRASPLLSTLVLLAAIGFLCRINFIRAQRVAYVSTLAQSASLTLDAASPTGYAGGIRQLIVPEHNNDSYQWLAQTQLMLAHHEWRLRHIDYDNAPNGRELRSPSLYRWWLAFVTWFEHKRSGQTLALSVEQAALSADPALQILLMVITVIFTAWRFGAVPASLLCFGFVALFPFASAFLPGQVDDYGLSLVGALWSLLSLLAGLPAPASPTKAYSAKTARRWFFFAGLVGGLSLWLSITRETPVLLGIALGGVLAAGIRRKSADALPLPWRAWALGGALTTLMAFLIEYFPSHLSLKAWRIESIHPLYAVAWIGLGEIVVQVENCFRKGKAAWSRSRLTATLSAFPAVAAIPAVVFLKEDRAWLSADALSARLTNLPSGATSDNVATWLAGDHFSAPIIAIFLPLLLFVFAGWLAARRAMHSAHRTALSLALGPACVMLGFACFHLRWWNFVDASLLAVVVALSAAFSASHARWLWNGLVALALVPGIFQLLPSNAPATTDTVTETEVVSLVERDLSHWLANRVGPDAATVLAPPSLTTSLYFHGGLRGIGTPDAANKEGFAAAVRLAAAESTDEAQALIRKRNVTHVIMPSWDPFLAEYARLGSSQPEHTLIGLLQRWLPPRWLRPVPYHLPQIAGFENQSVVVFEVVDIQDNPTALSNLAEYFSEMDQLDQAVAVSHTLEQSFPTDLGAQIAQAQVALAIKDRASFTKMVDTLVPRLPEDEAQGLAWARRVSLAIVLAEGKRFDPAREQVQRCLTEMDEHLMRSLSPLSLYRLQVLGKAFGVEIADPTLRELAHHLLPLEMRSAL